MHESMSQYETASATQRVVLLGASNLSRGFPVVVRNVQQLLGWPLDIVVAKGHGRSYGQDSTFFGKKVCGILRSDLWAYLERNQRVPTYALITDVGNDILYGVKVETILQWVAEAIERLHRQGAQVVMTDLPIGPIRHIGKMRFRLFRTLLFPACRLSLETVQARAEALSRALGQLAEDVNVPIYKAKYQWYGLDPIHLRRAVAAAAWAEILGQWTELPNVPTGPDSAIPPVFPLRNFMRYLTSFGMVVRPSRQPNILLRNGTTIAHF